MNEIYNDDKCCSVFIAYKVGKRVFKTTQNLADFLGVSFSTCQSFVMRGMTPNRDIIRKITLIAEEELPEFYKGPPLSELKTNTKKKFYS